MYVIEIIKCSSPSYWYADKIGQKYDIIEQKFCYITSLNHYEKITTTQFISIADFVYKYHKSLSNLNTDTNCRLNVNIIKSVDICDIKIYTLRELKIKQLLNAIS